MATAIIILKYFAFLIITIPWSDSFIDIRHRFELREIPIDLKKQILTECNSTLIKFFERNLKTSEGTTRSAPTTTKSETMISGTTKSHVSHVEETLPPDDQQCPLAVNNCIFAKTSPFMEHCDIKCSTNGEKSSNDFNCWNENCFTRATRICEDKFWRTTRLKYRKKKKKRMYCIPEIKHCYKLACLKCLGRECNMNCYGGGIQYTRLTKPRWKGYDEYKKFFPEVEETLHKLVLIPEKTVVIEDYNE
ncbi:unnamed protein product [Onchocerca flexuosa]|uniref:Hypotheticial protein n=1 Tax=Onchocerca flexuosa TaxID=387005 RepID=A0A183HM73_9BILA|nr:unnamed protein product [Onchocerca flexuosa]